MPTSFETLGPQGPFAHKLKWFSVRDCQREMAESVEAAIQAGQVALVESGTGTGKTFAYLVPPLLNKKKTIISTRTKYLQEQLFQKDIPQVCDTLGIYPKVKILKGRSNYLCLLRHDQATKQADLLNFGSKIKRVYEWVMERGDGDISEYEMRESERQLMTATAETCVGPHCNFWKDCFANQARNEAQRADVLVVNHNLLSLAVTQQWDDEFGILHKADVVIVDEAHRFLEIAAETLGIVFSKERLEKFCANLETAAQVSDLDPNLVASIARTMSETADSLAKEIGEDNAQLSLAEFEESSDRVDRYWQLVDILADTIKLLEPHIEQSQDVKVCCDQLGTIVDDARTIFERDSVETASWCETGAKGFSVHRLPLQPGQFYGPRIADFKGSWIFTSATMAVGEDFSHFQHGMGLNEVISARWESPFDFERCTLMYFPPEMPTPIYSSRDEFDRRVAEVVEQIVPLTRGRVLALFTSSASMKSARNYLADRIDYTLLCQYEKSNAQLLREFKRDGNAVLLGTMGFWEGVDIKGDALACVIIDKLPFQPFNTPREIARRNLMEESGKSFFNDYQVPNAVLTLKQGSGRLIRDVGDRGVLILCDPRIYRKGYGKAFLESLPPMPKTDSVGKVREFFST